MPPVPPWFRWVAYVMGALLAVCVALQYNDPDPARWIAIYGGALLVCVLALLQRLPRWLAVLVAAVALGWSALLLSRVLGVVSPLEIFAEFEMKSEPIEVAREGFGLLIVAAWMVVLARFGAARRRRNV